MYQAVCHYGTPAWSDEERAFAAAIPPSQRDINNSLNNIAGTSGEEGKTFARRHRDTLLIDEVAPGRPRITSSGTSAMLAGKRRWPSSFSPVLPHSWQLVSQGRTSIAQGMLLAGKVLAATAIHLFSDSALLEASQQSVARMPDRR